MNRTALVLAAHGSRAEPTANALVRRHADAIRARGLFDEVAVAFHEGEPGFGAVLDGLAADDVTVVPLMTSAGYYSERVLPEALRANRRYADVRLRLTLPVGTHPALAGLLGRRVDRLLVAYGINRASTTLVVVGHGTRRHRGSRESTLALAAGLRARRLCGDVVAAFLDDDPPLEGIAGRTTGRHLVVLPFLIGGAAHTVEDLPRAFGLDATGGAPPPYVGVAGDRRIVVDTALGSHDAVTDLIVDLARRHGVHLPAPATRSPAPGRVTLVGAGPGDPGLITVKGLEALRRADVVVHDRLVGPDLLREVRPGTHCIDVGKATGHAPASQDAINATLVRHARLGREVVRLKGGDPFVFGRGAEEVAACREAGVSCDVIPGVSSALAAPAAIGVPVTARGIGRSFAVVTAQTATEGPPVDVGQLAGVDTIVVLMGMARLAEVAQALIEAGRPATTPAACVQEATLATQRAVVATLGTIAVAAAAAGLSAPATIVIGEVVALARVEERIQPYVDSAAAAAS